MAFNGSAAASLNGRAVKLNAVLHGVTNRLDRLVISTVCAGVCVCSQQIL